MSRAPPAWGIISMSPSSDEKTVFGFMSFEIA